MNTPRYLRRDSSSANGYPPPYRESLPTETDDDLLHVTGLRRKKLVALIVWLAVLSLLVVILFITNVTLLKVLKMNVGEGGARGGARESSGTAVSTNQEHLVEEKKHHGHLPDTALVQVRNKVSEAVSAAEINSNTPVRSIVDLALGGLVGEILLTMPAKDTIKTRLTRHLNKNVGAVNRGEKSGVWPENMKQTKDGRTFLNFDSANESLFGPPLQSGFIGPSPHQEFSFSPLPHFFVYFSFHTHIDEKTKEKQSSVHFTSSKIDLGHVVVNSGKVLGQRDRTPLLIHGSRVIINTAENDTRLVLQDGLCRLENLEQFQVISGATGKTLFSAHHPLVSIDHRIKQIAARNIITNKIRSPVNEVLKLETENVNLRGNEGIRMDSKAFNATAKTTLLVKTSKDGSLRLSGRKIFIGNKWKVLSLSSSPALTASVDAFRVCICMSNRPKLFLVNGNKPCKAPATICQ